MSKILILGFIASLAIFTSISRAQPPQTLTYNSYSNLTLSPLDSQVDSLGQRTIYNTIQCGAGNDLAAWNDQDMIADLGVGEIAADQTINHTMCFVADYDDRREPPGTGNTAYPKVAVFRVFAPSDTLAVSLTDNAGHSWPSPPSVSYGNLRLWTLCVRDLVADAGNISHDADLPSYWPIVPGTTEGYGQIVSFTLHVGSPGRRTRNVSSYFEVAHGAPFPQRQTWQTPCPQSDGL